MVKANSAELQLPLKSQLSPAREHFNPIPVMLIPLTSYTSYLEADFCFRLILLIFSDKTFVLPLVFPLLLGKGTQHTSGG